VPHAPHPRRWPTHLGEVQPQSEQRYVIFSFAMHSP